MYTDVPYSSVRCRFVLLIQAVIIRVDMGLRFGRDNGLQKQDTHYFVSVEQHFGKALVTEANIRAIKCP